MRYHTKTNTQEGERERVGERERERETYRERFERVLREIGKEKHAETREIFERVGRVETEK